MDGFLVAYGSLDFIKKELGLGYTLEFKLPSLESDMLNA